MQVVMAFDLIISVNYFNSRVRNVVVLGVKVYFSVLIFFCIFANQTKTVTRM